MQSVSIKPEKQSFVNKKHMDSVLKPDFIDLLAELFRNYGYERVYTPLIVDAPASEKYIDAFKLGRKSYLRTSPELEMKQLLSREYRNRKIFQIGKCFRKNEKGRIHSEEFTMLEWYACGFDYLQLLDEFKNLLSDLICRISGRTEKVYGDSRINFAEAEILSVEEAFANFADFSMEQAVEKDCFEKILSSQIEPNLGFESPCFLINYPCEHSGFAVLNSENNCFAERWELYIAGIELANACTELVECAEMKDRLRTFAAAREANGLKLYPDNEMFLNALNVGIPNCAGSALGLERLLMILNNECSIDSFLL